MSKTDILIVGAGVAGLTLARELAAAGVKTRLIEKSRGVGGRCATRVVDGQPVDHGPAFFHGSDAEFMDAVERSDPEGLLPGWPRRIRGEGHPCQPRAFEPAERRCSFAGGVNVFPRHLARNLEIVRETRVETLATWEAPTVVVALPAPQALDLLATAGEHPVLDSARSLLAMVGTSCSLTVLAGYGGGAPVPGWDVCYPERSRILQTASHDSAKRIGPARTVLVLQALPAWSRKHQDDPREEWSAAILEEAGELFGEWAAIPEWMQAHRWRYARADHGIEFARPPLYDLGGGRRLGLAGEAFSPGGGIQAAWRSGRELARRWLREEGR